MPKLDGLKEELNGLRITISIIFALLVATTSGVIKRYDEAKLDLFFFAWRYDIFYLNINYPFFYKKDKTKNSRDKGVMMATFALVLMAISFVAVIIYMTKEFAID